MNILMDIKNDFEIVVPTNKPPVARSGHAAAADEACMYVYGGYNPHHGEDITQHDPDWDPEETFKHQVLNEVWTFNFSTHRWTKLDCQQTPPTAASASLLVLHNKLLAFGGTMVPWRKHTSRSLYSCDKNGGTWSLVPTISHKDDIPPTGYGQSTMFWNGYLYVFSGAIVGGANYDWTADLYRLNLKNLHWEMMEPEGSAPEGRYKQEVVKFNDNLYIIGGSNRFKTHSLKDLPVYSLKENMWNSIKTLPDPTFGYPGSRNCLAMAVRGSDVYIFGGRTFDYSNLANWVYQPEEYLDDVWYLSLKDLEWKMLPISLPFPVCFHSAVLGPSGHVYLYGGTLEEQRRNDKVVRLKLFLPKLKEICWERITSICRGHHPNDLKEALSHLLVPHAFLGRL